MRYITRENIMNKYFLLLMMLMMSAVLNGRSKDKQNAIVQNNIIQAEKLHETDSSEQRKKENRPVLIIDNRKYDLNSELNISSKDNLDREDLALLRNGIYAKHGLKFKTRRYSDYFSEIEWYKPVKDDVEKLLNETDKKNINSISALENSIGLRCSDHDLKIEDGESFQFSIDGIQRKLFVYKKPLPDIDENLNPLKITLEIEGARIELKNEMNSNISVYLTDFDNTDKYVDICVEIGHMDVGQTTSIFRYDGFKIEKYADIMNHIGSLLYDQKGKIYFWYLPPEKMQYDHCFDYKTKESYKLKSAITKR